MSSKKVTIEEVLAALSQVEDPELHKDLVSLKMVQDVVIRGDEVSFRVVLTTPACPLRSYIESEARAAVEHIPGVRNVKVVMDAAVSGDKRIQEMLNLPIRKAIAVASGKGGVGKTTVSVNMAVSLAKSGAKVGLMDADIYGPNVPIMMGLEHLPPAHNDKITPAEAYGVKVISIGLLVQPGQPLVWRGPMLHSAIRQFLSDVDWGELDYLIIDLPPGTGDAQLSLAQSLPLSGGLIVTLPQQVSLEDARRGLEFFRELQIPVLGVVENMSYLELGDGSTMDIFGKGGGEKLAQQSGVPFLGAIPMDPVVRQGGDMGKPVVLSHPESVVGNALALLAERVAAQLSMNVVR